MRLTPGGRLGPYEVLERVGAGGMGEVWRARDGRLGREVAIKVLPPESAEDAERLRRFEIEARSASALNHPAILTVHDVGSEGGVSYLVTELLIGRTLREVLDEGAVPPRRAIEWAAHISRGLAAAHDKGILHRDLKPENLFVTADGRVKILDFGLAKLAHPESGPGVAVTQPMGTAVSAVDTAETAATRAGMILGTAGYMAPEQVRAEMVDERCDIFALGCVLFEMLSGKRAFWRRSSVEALAATLTETPELPEGHDPRHARLVARCLARNREDRFASARQLAEEVESLRESEPAQMSASRRTAPVKKLSTPDSVAVLPFANDSADPELEYLSEGVAESLLDALTRIPKLRVLAHSTVMRFKGRLDQPVEVGRELGVAAVVTGRLRPHREEVRVSCELVRVADGARLWGHQYVRSLADLQALSEEIGERLGEQLRGKPAAQTARKPSAAPAVGTPSYQAYLRGRYLWNRWTPDSMRAAIRQYDEAIALEPTNALAWSGTADAWATLGEAKVIAPSEAFPQAKAAAQRALELDPQQPEAHASLAMVRFYWEWDWAGAESSFRRSLEIAPGYAMAHLLFSHLLSARRRPQEALAEAKRALELDPLSLIILGGSGIASFYARRYDEAIAYAQRALDLDPDFLAARSDLGRALEFAGRAGALEEYQKAMLLAGVAMSDPSSGLANALAVAGRTEEARAMLAELSRRRAERYVSSWALASIHARLGEPERALDLLESAFQEHDTTLVWLAVHPRFDSLQGNPRFQALLDQMRLA